MNKKDFTLIEPNIWKHNNEQKYVVDIFLGRDENGKQQRTSKTCYSLKEAQTTLALAKADKIKGVAKTKSKTPTIFELMENYRQVYIEVNTEQTTSYGYSVIENHIKAFFEATKKNTRIDKIIEMLNLLHNNGDISLKCAVLTALFAGTRRGETDYLK